MPLAAALIAALILAACGSQPAPVPRPTKNRHGHSITQVHIYSALPLHGPMGSEGQAVQDGIELAVKPYLPPHRLGSFELVYTSLDDASSSSKPGSDANRSLKPGSRPRPASKPGARGGSSSKSNNLATAAANALKVATDPRAVYYIGDFSSASTAVSLPVIGAAGIAQVTPNDPYVAPSATTGSTSTESPELLRLMPGDDVQAAADLMFFKQAAPCTVTGSVSAGHVLAVSQGDLRDLALVKSMYADRAAYGIDMPTPATLSVKAGSVAAYVATLKGQTPCGFAIAGRSSPVTVQLAKTLHLMFPNAYILGTRGLCNSNWTNPAHGGVPAGDDRFLFCTSPLLPLVQYKDAAAFVKQYRRLHRQDPSPYALYGYEAAELGISAIKTLESSGNDRSAVKTELDVTYRASVLGPYGFLQTGESTLRDYGLYDVDPHTDDPAFVKILNPPLTP
jgi:branched-chain amino acid transport system substrate-binding protein